MHVGDVDNIKDASLMNAVKQWVFWLVHFACLLVVFVGFSWVGLAVCLFLYVVRMFGITAGFHRYFSHRTYQTSRLFQFLMGFLGTTSAQKGPIWWASHHRHHHKHSDTEEDVHSPVVQGIYYSHVGWVLSTQFVNTKEELVRDLSKFRELRWLDNWYIIPPFLLALATYFLGVWLNYAYPSLGTNGFQMLVWGFFVSTVLLYHGTFCINSFTHLIGRRRFNTTDHSRNNALLALITLGEGWHNNHHRYPGSEKQGFYWWEFDISHYTLKFLSWFGIVWDLRTPPKRIYEEAKATKAQA